MEKMHELKEMLTRELDNITKKGELSAGSLDIVDKITHSIKSIDTIMAMEGYSNDGRSYDGGYSNRGYSNRGRSYDGGYSNNYSMARGRGSNANRDSMGRYSSRGYSRDHQEIVEELRELAQNATSEEMRDMIHDWIRQAEQ